MSNITIHSIEDVLEQSSKVKIKKKFVVDGVLLKKTQLLQLVEDTNSVECVCCKQSALYFTSFENHIYPSEHKLLQLMFEHTSPHDGGYAFMTRDHIVPKKLGGPNTISNYQLMCDVCNVTKGHHHNSEHIGKITITQNATNTPKINRYHVEIYKGYIRWYTLMYHRNASLKRWESAIRPMIACEASLITVMPFDVAAFNCAYDELIDEIKFTHRTWMRSDCVNPATFFYNDNRGKI